MSQKYPDPINGFDFIIGRGGKPTYRLNKKMTAAENVPEDIKATLLTQYEQLAAVRAEENAKAEAEEAAKQAADLVNNPPVAAEFIDETAEYPADTLDQVEIAPPAQLQSTPPAPNPFAPSALENVQSIADVIPNPAPSQEMTAEEQAILNAYPTDPSVVPTAPAAPLHTPLAADEHPSMRIAALEQENERMKGMLKELLASSVFEADLKTLAEQLAERFNIYTVFIGREPSHTDLHPITAEVMNNFDRGLAYKQYVRATLSGVLGDLDRNIAIAQADPRFERPVPQTVQPLPPQYQTVEQRAESEQSHLSSNIKNAESYGIDGIIQDPPVMANGFARQIVDTSWLNKAKTIDQFDLEQL